MNILTIPLTRLFALAAVLAGITTQLSAQTYTSFDADPHATFPDRIDSSGRIVGTVFHANQTYGGFVRNTDGSIILINFPGAIETDWVGFAGSNQIAGRYSDSAYREHGFFGPVSGPYTSFDVPGAKQTSPTAGNSVGQITSLVPGRIPAAPHTGSCGIQMGPSRRSTLRGA